VGVVTILLAGLGCGYHTTGKAVRLPDSVHSIYVPMFINATQAFRVEQVLTSAVVQELRSRTNFQVVVSDDASADATLRGTVTNIYTAALTYDANTGKVSSSELTIVMKVALVDKNGTVLWENPSYWYREQYELSQAPASFFEEENPAARRIAHDFAKALVSNIVEAY
jgi:hypothetical protein